MQIDMTFLSRIQRKGVRLREHHPCTAIDDYTPTDSANERTAMAPLVCTVASTAAQGGDDSE